MTIVAEGVANYDTCYRFCAPSNKPNKLNAQGASLPSSSNNVVQTYESSSLNRKMLICLFYSVKLTDNLDFAGQMQTSVLPATTLRRRPRHLPVLLLFDPVSVNQMLDKRK